MRISDWSSDVCSSDLLGVGHDTFAHDQMSSRKYPTGQASTSETSCFETDTITCETSDDMAKGDLRGRALYDRLMLFKPAGLDEYEWAKRSEEHTSELQSLMRISYAVFCLKKKTKTNKHS